MKNYRQKYKSGDLVIAYEFPYNKLLTDEFQSSRSKPRPAIVLGETGRSIAAIPVMGVYTKGRMTEKEGYSLYRHEVRVPKGLTMGQKELEGVIKTDRVVVLERHQISSAFDEFPLRTKMDILSTYEDIKNLPFYKKSLDQETTYNHERIMRNFKENVIAERLNFLTNKEGENVYEFKKYDQYQIDKIQHIGTFKDLNIYAVNLQSTDDNFIVNLATNKPVNKIVSDWSGTKTAKEWLREDAKYHALNKNIDQNIRRDPFIHPDKFIRLDQLSKNAGKNNIKEKGLER